MEGEPHPLQKMPFSAKHMHHSHHAHQIHGCLLSSSDEMQEEEELDPRIQVELEKLNRATEEINRLELELDDARAAFRQVLSDSTQRLNGLAKKLGACVDKARPYYDARMKLKEAHLDSQKAALRFERACSMHEAAKEMVQLAEEGYKRRELDVDPTWQEMLNHATMKVNDAERERMESEDYHQCTTLNFKKRDEEVQKLQKDLKRAITKSKPYFEMKAKFNQVMEDHKRNVSRLEEDVCSTKALYSEALRSLEAISDDIHRQRLERRQKMQLGVREAGVGAESPSPPPSWVKGAEGSVTSVGFHPDGDRFCMTSLNQSLQSDNLNSDDTISEGTLDSDPLNVVVFRHPSKESRLSSQLATTPRHHGHMISNEPHSSSPQPGFDSNKEYGGGSADTCVNLTDRGENLNFAEETSSSMSSDAIHSKNIKISNHKQKHPSNQSRRDKNLSPLLPDPNFSQHEVNVAHQSSLSRAQEWVNKSPIPQQRRFVKSKSLIDASSPTVVTESASSPSPLSSSLTSDAMKLLQAPRKSNFGHVVLPEGLGPLCQTPSTYPVNKQASSSRSPVSYSSPKSSPSTSEQFSPLSSSPSAQRESSPVRKSPKLRGLILRIDTEAINTSSTSSISKNPVVKATSVVTKDTSPVIFTNPPNFRELNIRQQSQQQTTASAFMKPLQSAPASVSNSMASMVSVSNATPAQCLSHPAVASTTSPVSLAKSLVSKVSSFSSKTAPSSLGGTYHLPSPTHSTRLSLVPPNSHRQAISPTPLSPSGDRFSISSGRSDSLSASNRGSLLKVPSDSSDTESIASTGPMLDDDQVEYLTMDFNEQSIQSHRNEDDEVNEFMDDRALCSIQRGHWSRMSLPPRLSHLEGYLDRARHISSKSHGDYEGVDMPGECRNDEEANEDTLSVEASVDQDHASQNDLDMIDCSPIEVLCEAEETEADLSFVERSSIMESLEITLYVDNSLVNENEDDHERNNTAVVESAKEELSQANEACSSDVSEDEGSQLKAEATIVLSPDGAICEIENKSSDV